MDTVRSDDIGSVVSSLLVVSDRLITYSHRQQFNTDIRQTMIFIIESLLSRPEINEEVGILAKSAEDSNSVIFLSYLLGQYRRDHGEAGDNQITEQERLLNSDELERLKSVFIENIAEAAQSGDLLRLNQIKFPLQQWSEWADSDDAQQWVSDIAQSDSGLLLLIDRIILDSSVSSDSEQLYTDPRWVSKYLELSEVKDRIEAIDRGKLSDERRRSVEIFNRGVELLEEGKDPSSPGVWLSPYRGE